MTRTSENLPKITSTNIYSYPIICDISAQPAKGMKEQNKVKP